MSAELKELWTAIDTGDKDWIVEYVRGVAMQNLSRPAPPLSTCLDCGEIAAECMCDLEDE